MTGRRWRVLRRAGPGEVRVEIDTGGGFRPASLPEIDKTLQASVEAECPSCGELHVFSTGGGTIEPGAVQDGEPGAVRSGPVRGAAVNATVEGARVDLLGGYLRPRGTDDEIRRRRAGGESLRSIARACGVGLGTVQRAIKRGGNR